MQAARGQADDRVAALDAFAVENLDFSTTPTIVRSRRIRPVCKSPHLRRLTANQRAMIAGAPARKNLKSTA